MKLFPIFFLLLFPLLSRGQKTPYGLRLPEVQEEILQQFEQFENLLLTNIASFWGDEKVMYGTGIMDGKNYLITLHFKDDTSSFYDIKPGRMKLRKVKTEECPMVEYEKLSMLNMDSLNLRSRSGSQLKISDQEEWTLLIIHKGRLFLKQSYAPELYQSIAFVEEREYFMKTVLLFQKEAQKRKRNH